jgi:hypothetical protein
MVDSKLVLETLDKKKRQDAESAKKAHTDAAAQEAAEVAAFETQLERHADEINTKLAHLVSGDSACCHLTELHPIMDAFQKQLYAPDSRIRAKLEQWLEKHYYNRIRIEFTEGVRGKYSDTYLIVWS